MCGITGIFNYNSRNQIEKSVLSSMCNIIRHRGPDDEGIYINDEHFIGLGHRRLSIIDLSTGHQPMSNKDETIWISFNGEIYNFLELKKELENKGQDFLTKSDTEVIICLFREYGEKAFDKLNGIFAFALYDILTRTLYLVRDHFGVKPLYYHISNNGVIFGSEIKSILVNSDYKKELDYDSLDSFLTFRYNPSPQTLFKDIKKLNPGYCLKLNSEKEPELFCYSDYEPDTFITIQEDEAVEEYQRLLEQAIKRQMISDVPIGSLLSGGMDSAVISKIMSLNTTNKFNTYTIGFEGQGDYNELNDAKKTAMMIHSEHKSLILSKKDYLDFFFKSFYFIEEPISETTIPALYYLCRLVSKDIKVVLTGQGADEPLAGYKRYLGEKYLFQYSSLLKHLPVELINKYLPRNERVKRALYASRFPGELERFLAIYTIFNPLEKQKLYNEFMSIQFRNEDLALIKGLYDKTKNLKDTLNKLLFIDTRLSLSDDLLLFGDKISMANSIEMRVPFLDIEMVQFLESLPSEMKLKNRIHKYIHKKAVRKWLPENIINRKKRGFATPMDEWLQSDLSTFLRKILLEEKSFALRIMNKLELGKLLDEHYTKKQNHTRKLFCLMSLEVWYKNYFENSRLEKEFNYFDGI